MTDSHFNTMPKLRFTDFDGAWAKNSSSIRIVAGKAYPLHMYGDSGALLVQGQNIFPNELKIDQPTYIPEKHLSEKDAWLKIHDILLGLNRPLLGKKLKACLYLESQEAVLYQRAGKLIFNRKEIESAFLFHYLFSQPFTKQLLLELVGSDQPYIKSDLFKVTRNFFPTLPEQQKIANFLSSVDKRIEQLTQKKSLLEQYKKGVMQQLFTQKIRFKDDDGGDFPDWEEKKLGEVAHPTKKWSFTGGPFGSNLKSEDYTEKGIRIIQLQNIGDGRFHDDYKIYTSEVKATELLSCNIYPGDLILSKMGDPVARACIIPDYQKRYVMCSDGIRLAIDQSKFASYFIFSQINHRIFRHRAIRVSTGSTRKRIGLNDLKRLTIKAPSLPEQTKVANFFSALDRKIETVASQIAEMQTFKRGLLQQMFV